MRILIAALAAAAVAGLAFTADAAPASKKKQGQAMTKEKTVVQPRGAARSDDLGYDQTPDHWPVGSNEWWRAMDRDGRGGCCGANS